MLGQSTLLWVAYMATFSAAIISGHLIYKHQQHFTKPLIQSKIIGILWMVPIYSVNSMLSLLLPSRFAIVVNMLRDCYEAYVLYLFLALLLAYLGDERDTPCSNADDYAALTALESLKPQNYDPGPTMMSYGKMRLRYYKFGVLQYCMIRPLATLLAIILEFNDIYHEGDLSIRYGFVYVTMIVNSSVCYALYVLACFYAELHGKLKPYKPMAKFLCLKFVIFFIFWQSIAIAVMIHAGWITTIGDYSSQDAARAIQDFLICLEMVIASISMQVAFTYRPYTEDSLRMALFERVASGATFGFDKTGFAYSPLDFGEVCAPMNYFGLEDGAKSAAAQDKTQMQQKRNLWRGGAMAQMSPHAPRSLVGGPVGEKRSPESDHDDADDILLFSIPGEQQGLAAVHSPATAHQLGISTLPSSSLSSSNGRDALSSSSASALLNNNFASATAVRDFNQMLLPVLLPTGFEPTKGVVVYSNPMDRMQKGQGFTKSTKVSNTGARAPDAVPAYTNTMLISPGVEMSLVLDANTVNNIDINNNTRDDDLGLQIEDSDEEETVFFDATEEGGS